jgi:sugar porter (SP) family MFS transporter
MSSAWKYALIAALSGLLFGFDTAVISGADQELQTLWKTSDFFHGFVVMGFALWGTVVGAIFGAWPNNRWGRKSCLMGIAAFYLISALGSALASDPYVFAAFRFLGGLAIGVSTITAPAYITEIATNKQRGRLVGLYQSSIVSGILMALLSNYFIAQWILEEAWRWMLGVEVIPALLFFFLAYILPQSPAWLISKGKVKQAESIAQKFDIPIITESNSQAKTKTLYTRAYRKSMYVVIFIAFFNQLSGINAILYYAPRIFQESGLTQELAFLSTAGIGLVNLGFTLIGMSLIDRWGRKNLLYFGGIGYLISLTGLALAFFLNTSGLYVVGLIFLFIASHALGQGTVIWVFIAELFPTHLRASGQALGSSVHWILAAIVPSSLPYLIAQIGATGVFAFFAFAMLLQVIWIYLKVPETKGKSSEAIQVELS